MNWIDGLGGYWRELSFYVPLGIVGVWRWGVWLIRRLLGMFYRVPRGNFSTTLSIVTPVYNEDPKFFAAALDSWKANKPEEIIAVIDYTDKSSIKIFQKFAEGFSGAKLIITKKQGKRPALADGVKASTSEIVALVDSDTLWSPGLRPKIVGPFADPKVGGLSTRQDVLYPDTLARRLFKIHLDNRYLFEFPFLAASGDALLCLSGRTAVYRRKAIEGKMSLLVSETFWGQKMISGDDKSLTHLVQSSGWKTRFVKNAKVYTIGAAKMSDYLKQHLRWSRNGLRSDLKALMSRWLWRDNKVLALHMLDKFVQPVVLLLGPVYFSIAIYFGHWPVAVVILFWWILSRAVKIYPHLKEMPGDIFLLPHYILISFAMAVVKVFALVTIDRQGWITRWSKKRFSPVDLFHRVQAYGATLAIIGGLVFGVVFFKNQAIQAAQFEVQRNQAVKLEEKQRIQAAIFTPEYLRKDQAEIEKTKAALLADIQSDPHGYYVVKRGDTLATIRSRFNLPAGAPILDGKSKAPLPLGVFLGVGRSLAFKVEDLRNPLSKEVLVTKRFAKPPRVNYDRMSNTIFVRQSGSVANLTKIQSALGPAGGELLEQFSPGQWILRANLYISKDVTLVVDGAEAKELRLKSDDEGFVWVRSESGNMLFSDTKVTSWDEKRGAPDVSHKEGRSYITAKNSGRMDVLNSEIAYLGYEGLPRRGGLFGGSYGISWKIKNGGFRDSLLAGVVTNNKFHHNYFGFYTYGVTGMLVRGNEAYENIEYGFDPHDDSNLMLIEDNRAYRNGNHGIIISKRCVNNIIRGNYSYNNRLHGIMLDRSSNNNLVQNNTVYGNVDGIALYGSSGNVIVENTIRKNVRGIRMNAGSQGNYLERNEVSFNSRGIYVYGQSQENIAVSNRVRENDIGITLKAASRNILHDNFNLFENRKDGQITADSYENNIF